jgi:IS5 family transposase
MPSLVLIKRSEINRVLALIDAAARGEQAWPSLALFRALLLAVWYDLSDVKLAEPLEDRMSVRPYQSPLQDNGPSV